MAESIGTGRLDRIEANLGRLAAAQERTQTPGSALGKTPISELQTWRQLSAI